MKRGGSADLTLMGGSIPFWLFDRMTQLSLPIVESINATHTPTSHTNPIVNCIFASQVWRKNSRK